MPRVTPHALDRLFEDIEEAGRIRDELVAERSGGSLEAFERYADDPVGFFRDVLRVEYIADYQVAHAESVRDNPRTVVRGCHGAGKEWEAGRIALWAAYARGMLVLIISQTEKQVVGQTMREVADGFLGARDDLPGRMLTRSLRINGRNRILTLTGGAKVDALTGWHDRRGVLVIISEGQGEQLEDVAYDAAFSNTTDDRSRILALGNPVRSSGRFRDINSQDNWRVFKISAFDHPNVKEGHEVIPGGPTRRWVEDVKREYGEDSAYYTSRVLAEFPSQDTDALIRREWIDKAIKRHAQGQWPEKWVRARLVLDPSGEGADEFVAGVVRGQVLERFVVWAGGDSQQAMAGVETLAKDIESRDSFRVQRERTRSRLGYGPGGAKPSMTVDAVGLGWSMVGWLRERGYSVTDFRGSRAARRPDRFESRKAEAWWSLRERLQDGFTGRGGPIYLPHDTKMIDDLLAMRWSIGTPPSSDREPPRGSTADRVMVSTKREVRRVLGRSPDRGDVVAMAFGDAAGRTPDTRIIKYSS